MNFDKTFKAIQILGEEQNDLMDTYNLDDLTVYPEILRREIEIQKTIKKMAANLIMDCIDRGDSRLKYLPSSNFYKGMKLSRSLVAEIYPKALVVIRNDVIELSWTEGRDNEDMIIIAR